jgi:hypothetical protein
MKNLYFWLSFTIVISLLLLSACKKDKETEIKPQNDCTCSTQTFETNISNNTPVDFTEDQLSNTLVLANSQETSLIKINDNGEVTWTLDNTYISNNAISVECLKDNSIIVVSKEEENISCSYLNYSHGMYVQNGKSETNNCPDAFTYATTIVDFEVKSRTKISKFDPSGNFLWAKIFDGAASQSKSIVAINEDQFFLALYQAYGKNGEPSFVTDADGSIIYTDTLKCPMDRNTIDLLKIDADGELIKEKQINNLYASNYTNAFYQIDMVKLNDQLAIRCEQEIVFIDFEGNITDRITIKPDWCSNKTQTISAGNHANILVSGWYNIDYNQTTSYTQKVNASGSIEWENEAILSFGKSYNNTRYVSNYAGTTQMYDLNQNLLWSRASNSLFGSFVNCNKGATIIESNNEINGFKVIRTDENGNY